MRKLIYKDRNYTWEIDENSVHYYRFDGFDEEFVETHQQYKARVADGLHLPTRDWWLNRYRDTPQG